MSSTVACTHWGSMYSYSIYFRPESEVRKQGLLFKPQENTILVTAIGVKTGMFGLGLGFWGIYIFEDLGFFSLNLKIAQTLYNRGHESFEGKDFG